MYAKYILLGWVWQFDRYIIYESYTNRYLLVLKYRPEVLKAWHTGNVIQNYVKNEGEFEKRWRKKMISTNQP